MKKFRWNYGKALNFVKTKRSVAKPNKGFEKQLLNLEKELGLEVKHKEPIHSGRGIQNIPPPSPIGSVRSNHQKRQTTKFSENKPEWNLNFEG